MRMDSIKTYITKKRKNITKKPQLSFMPYDPKHSGYMNRASDQHVSKSSKYKFN